jgi:hypothetical protein
MDHEPAILIEKRDDLGGRPYAVRDPGGHRPSLLDRGTVLLRQRERLVGPGEVVVHELDRQGGHVVNELLAARWGDD